MKKIKSLIVLSLACMACTIARAQQNIDLWPNGMPNSNGMDTTQPFDDSKQNFKPSIRVFHPSESQSNHMAVVCLPGGGYTHLATDHEGYDWSSYFCGLGFTYVVLKYRMPKGHTEVPVSDAAEAMRLVREHASEWGIDARKVGIMGSSAGGHLASTIATHSDSLSKPYFQILFYPVISMETGVTHQNSRDNLLGYHPAREQVERYSNALQVDSATPKAILLLSDDDKAVSPKNGVEYYLALKEHHVPASLHVYPSGGHGWGYRTSFAFHKEMLDDLTAWLKTLK